MSIGLNFVPSVSGLFGQPQTAARANLPPKSALLYFCAGFAVTGGETPGIYKEIRESRMAFYLYISVLYLIFFGQFNPSEKLSEGY